MPAGDVGSAMDFRAAGRARAHREFSAKTGPVTAEADESAGWLELIEVELAPISESAWRPSESNELVAILGSAMRRPDKRTANPECAARGNKSPITRSSD